MEVTFTGEILKNFGSKITTDCERISIVRAMFNLHDEGNKDIVESLKLRVWSRSQYVFGKSVNKSGLKLKAALGKSYVFDGDGNFIRAFETNGMCYLMKFFFICFFFIFLERDTRLARESSVAAITDSLMPSALAEIEQDALSSLEVTPALSLAEFVNDNNNNSADCYITSSAAESDGITLRSSLPSLTAPLASSYNERNATDGVSQVIFAVPIAPIPIYVHKQPECSDASAQTDEDKITASSSKWDLHK